jgi:hypothetical protein
MNTRHRLHRQRGAASLVVVAVLFLILSLVAAYTNRNLIFEQRTSGNLYRSTQAFEAAEAGVEWSLTMLNAGRLDASCTPSVNVADTTFRQRYLAIDPSSGVVSPAGVLTPGFESTVWPSCVFNGNDWNCSCPAAGAPALAAPAGTAIFPAFRVRFSRASVTQPGVVRLEVNGCTRLDDDCLNFPAQAVGGEGRATVTTLIALRSALPAPPLAALTVQGDIDVGAATLSAFNADAASGGISILAGSFGGNPLPPATMDYGGPAGTPPDRSIRTQAALPVDRTPPYTEATLFTHMFAIWPDLYRGQPGAVVLDCSAGCNAQTVRDAAQANPGRVLWADGNLTLAGGGDIGSPAAPVLLVVAGSDADADGVFDAQVEIDVDLHGLLMVFADEWDSAGSGMVRGAVLTDGNLAGAGGFTAVYDRALLDRLRWTTGTFVRVPGGWRDF